MNRTPLMGAIVGGIAGSRFEWLNCKSKRTTAFRRISALRPVHSLFLISSKHLMPLGIGIGEVWSCEHDSSNRKGTCDGRQVYEQSQNSDESVLPASLKVRNLRSYP